MPQDPIDVLKDRARALAQKAEVALSVGTSLTLFSRGKLAGKSILYGVRTEEVEGAGRLRHLSAIPAAPSWMVGAVQHQGAVLTLVDLPAFWGQELEGIADLPTYLVITDGERRIGVLVEDLHGVLEVEGAPVLYKGPERSGLTSMARRAGEPVLVISGPALLQDTRLKL
jgi:chemotaxis signal transduction protein